MKSRGSILTEVMVGILIFTVGLAALAGTIMFSMKIIKQSGETTLREQEILNAAESYMAKRFYEEDGSPEPPAEAVSGLGGSIKLGNKTINYDVYRYRLTDKKGSEIYLLQRKN